MTLYLDDVFSLNDLDKEIEEGYVRVRRHPADPTYEILNYTEKAQYEKRWNPVTMNCRGLIVRDMHDDGYPEVLARPWPKFFNYGERDIAFDPEAMVEVLDKVDGSLGILYRGPEGWAIATRGSFESEQAIHATYWMQKFMHETGWRPSDTLTYLFEIVYPGNRIVVDYGQRDELILLGVVHTDNGTVHGPGIVPSWPGARVEVFQANTFAEALAMPPRPNAEGIVVRFWADGGTMVKIKQEDYVRLHKLVTGLSERAVWEHLAEHDNVGSLLEQIPDEFHDWVLKVSEDLLHKHLDIYAVALAEHTFLLERLGDEFERREYAINARELTYPSLMFLLLDGRDTSEAIYKMIRPVGHRPMTNRNEDNA